MRKFEQVLKQKAHLNKIKNAKKTISATNKNNNNKIASSKVNDQAQLLLKLYQNKNYDSIPAYKLLRTANLQQYTKGFIIRGYGINLGSLALLNEDEKKKLYEDLKVLPGHTVKLDQIIKTIVKQSYQDIFQDSQLSDTRSVTKSAKKQKTNYTQMHKNNKIFEEDNQFEKQLQKAMNQYTSPVIMTQNKISHKSSTGNDKRSSMMSTGQNNNSKLKYLPPKNTQTSDFRKKVVPDPSTKSTIRKSASIISQKDKKEQGKQQSSKQALGRLLKGVTAGSVIQSKKVLQIDLELNKIRDLYKSFDGAVMSSTIANLDVEQLVYAFAGCVADLVKAAPEPAQKTIEPSLELNLNFNKRIYEDSLDHNTSLNQANIDKENQNNTQVIQDEIGSILRQSYMHPLYRESNIMQDIDCDEVNSQGEHQQEDQQIGGNIKIEANEFGQNSIDKNMMESSFLGGQSFQFGLAEPIKIYEEPDPTQIDYFKPTVDSIFNFIKNIVLAAKMQREIPVMAAAYLQTFLTKSNVKLTSLNYKRLLVTCLLLASKIWDDESFQTPSFSKTFPEYSTILLNEMQKQLLKFLQYKLKIDKKQYALTYFRLRKFIKKNIKSYQNRKLNIKKIRELQNGIKIQYKTNYLTKRNSF